MNKRKNYAVVKKDNYIVQNRPNKMTKRQKDLLATLLATMVIKEGPGSDELTDITLTLTELCSLLEIPNKGSRHYSIIREIKSFADNASFGYEDDTQFIYSPFFSKVRYDKVDKTVHFLWNKEMKPYLLHLKTCYTSYLLGNYLALTSGISKDLYEQLKSWEGIGFRKFSLTDLRMILNCTSKYKRSNSFIEKVVEAVEDINSKTDLRVVLEKEYKTSPKGREATALIFKIRSDGSRKAYLGTHMSYEEQDHIVSNLHAKRLIVKVGEMKEKNPQLYKQLKRKYGTDYKIVIHFYEEEEENRKILEGITKMKNQLG